MFSYSIHRLRPRTNATLSLPNYKFHSNLFHPITSPIKTLNSHTKNATTPRATFHHHRSKNSQDKFHLIMPPGKTPVRRRSTLDIDFAMDKQPPPAPGGIFNVVFIGAGGINFGSKSEGAPWNHSFRLEHKLGPRLRVVALIDPNPETCRQVLETKRNSFVTVAYADTKEYRTLEDYIEDAKANPFNVPHAAIIGSPPMFHGSIQPGRNAEVLLSKTFPNIAMFVEKPISTSPVADVMACSHFLKERKHIVSVGYMLRYLKCVQKMKEIIAQEKLTVMGITCRYIAAYAKIDKLFWWDKDGACGPIVEQGTHFVDLCRYIGGEVNLDTIQAQALEYNEKAGKLSALKIDEDRIPPERRIPRMTVATWKFESGAVCSFTHGLVLHGSKYDATMEVYCDGWSFRLVDPYGTQPSLYVRSPTDPSDGEIVHSVQADDPYNGEFSTFIDAVDNPSPETMSLILSTFDDAVKTYDLTWRIRLASEASSARLAGKGGSGPGAPGGSLSASLESTTSTSAGPTPATASEEKNGNGKSILENVKEGVEKLGLK